jgi:osmotically-inducible protein OsmY
MADRHTGHESHADDFDEGRADRADEATPREIDLRPGHGRFFGRGPKNYHRTDERIREEICDRLTTHPDIDASDLEIDVAKGVVTMTGTVETSHEKRIADLIADDVAGVDDVNNMVKVRHGFWSNIAGDRTVERPPEREPRRDERE